MSGSLILLTPLCGVGQDCQMWDSGGQANATKQLGAADIVAYTNS